MASIKERSSIDVPYRNSVVELATGILSLAWQNFFRSLYERVYPLGIETSFIFENNKTDASNIEGLQFDSNKVTQVFIEYVIQRIHGPKLDPVEKIQTGVFAVVYKPAAELWSIVNIGTPGPDNAGITFSITAGGQVQYTSSNITGAQKISKITWRARTLGAKVAL